MATQNWLMLITAHPMLLRLSTMVVIVVALYFAYRVLAFVRLEELAFAKNSRLRRDANTDSRL